MDYDLQVFANFLYENKEDPFWAKCLLEEKSKAGSLAIRAVKERNLYEISNADYLKKNWDNLVLRDTNKILEKRERLEKELADAENFDPEKSIDLALDIISIMSGLKFNEKELEQYKTDIKEIDGLEDAVSKKRKARILGFRLLKSIDNARETLSNKDIPIARAIVTKAGKTILEPAKGKNSDSSVRNEVNKVVNQAAITAEQEIGSVDRLTKTLAEAKIYAGMIFKEFWNEQFEGTKKAEQFDKRYKELLSKKDEIEKTEGGRKGEAESALWNELNIYSIMADLRDFSTGKSTMTVEQVKEAIKKLKKSNLDALELVNRFISGKT